LLRLDGGLLVHGQGWGAIAAGVLGLPGGGPGPLPGQGSRAQAGPPLGLRLGPLPRPPPPGLPAGHLPGDAGHMSAPLPRPPLPTPFSGKGLWWLAGLGLPEPYGGGSGACCGCSWPSGRSWRRWQGGCGGRPRGDGRALLGSAAVARYDRGGAGRLYKRWAGRLACQLAPVRR